MPLLLHSSIMSNPVNSHTQEAISYLVNIDIQRRYHQLYQGVLTREARYISGIIDKQEDETAQNGTVTYSVTVYGNEHDTADDAVAYIYKRLKKSGISNPQSICSCYVVEK